jgi:hypothetical protein
METVSKFKDRPESCYAKVLDGKRELQSKGASMSPLVIKGYF